MDNLIEACSSVLTEDQEKIAKLSKIFEENEIKLYGKDGKFWVSSKENQGVKISMSWQSISFLQNIISKATK